MTEKQSVGSTKTYLSIHQWSVPSHLAAYHRSVEEAETERKRDTFNYNPQHNHKH